MSRTVIRGLKYLAIIKKSTKILTYNQRMKRLALSVFSGLVIPFTYTVVAATVSPYINNETLDRLAGYPVRWPLLILYRLGLPVEKDVATILYAAGCNVLLYALLTFFFLWGIRKRKTIDSAPPPNPPRFVQD